MFQVNHQIHIQNVQRIELWLRVTFSRTLVRLGNGRVYHILQDDFAVAYGQSCNETTDTGENMATLSKWLIRIHW